ncbi:SIMPL domain-containing protein [Pseudoxanthomonas sp. 10H]|uniref:SIMPL domain-containing protein n=1 Tax=Pseudoxanthomonas sp. 10H TaxID=3242729 RepID=UPI003556E783
MAIHPRAALRRLLLAVLFAVPWTAAAQQPGSLPSQPHLLVKGQAERKVKPDRFSIDLLLQETDMDAAAARARVQAHARQVVEAMKASGALAETIDASTLSIAPHHEYVENRQVFRGTRVSRTIRGSFGSTAGLRGFLGQLQTSDALQVSGMRTGYSGAGPLRARLKADAATQARRSAEGLASAYGTRVSGLYTISDVAPGFAYGVQAGTWPSNDRHDDAPASPPAPAPVADIGAVVVSGSRIDPEVLESGTLTFTENVYAIFLIE